MKIKAFQNDRGGCYYYRLFLPFTEAKKHGYDFSIADEVTIYDQTGSKLFHRFHKFFKLLFKVIPESWFHFKPVNDLVVYQRQHNNRGEIISARFQQLHGCKMVYELDDLLSEIDKSNPCFDSYMKPEYQEIIHAFFHFADAITVSTEYLKRKILPFNPNVYILPNSLELKMWNTYLEEKKQRVRGQNEIVKIGYAGSTTHAPDIAVLRYILPAALKMNPNARLKFIGYDWSAEVFKKDFKEVKNQIEFHPWVPLTEYPRGLLDIDIGIAPLAYSEFNRAKSNVKFLEYSALEIPTIATNIEPYEEIEDGETGYKIKKNKESEWISKLNLLIRNKSVRKRIGENAREHVAREYDIAKNWEKWLDVYKEVLRK